MHKIVRSFPFAKEADPALLFETDIRETLDIVLLLCFNTPLPVSNRPIHHATHPLPAAGSSA